MSNTETKSSAGPVILGIVVGIALMIGGGWFSQTQHPAFMEALAKQGIPLDLGKTFSIIGVFLILFPVIKFFFINPLAGAINERTTSLERTFGEAEELRAEMTQMRSDYEARLARTEAEAREQIQNQIKEAQQLRQTLMNEATAKADELVRKAELEIQNEKTRVLSELRLEVVNLTLTATEKIIGENMDSDKNRKLITDFINQVEVKA